MKHRLLPRPFCGYSAVIKEHNERNAYKVVCTSKDLCIGNMTYLWSETEEEAAKVRNRRAAS